MEACASFEPWHDKQTGRTFLKGREAKCLHYYFYFLYFLHEEFGLCYLRVPTWAPFRLQFYCNGSIATAITGLQDNSPKKASRSARATTPSPKSPTLGVPRRWRTPSLRNGYTVSWMR
jgi:hypothetical protein